MTSAGTSIGADASSAGPPTRFFGRRWLVILACIVVVLLLAEAGTRAIASHLPAPLQWDTYETQRKVAQIDALSHQGGAKVVFVGSSVVDVGVDPVTVDNQIGGGVTSYNAGLASAIPRLTALWTERVVIPKLHPSVIVIGLNPYDIGAEGVDRTAFYNAFRSSSGGRALLGTDDPIQAADRWLGQHSSLWLHKYQLRDPATVWRALEGHTPVPDLSVTALSPLGRQTADQYSPFADITRADVHNWSIGTKDTDALEQLIAAAHREHIAVVLVDMPVTHQFVSQLPQGNTSYTQFADKVAAIGRSTDSVVLDYGSVRTDVLFNDTIHLNHTGAELLSARLGQALAHLTH